MPLQQKPLFGARLCGSLQRLRGFVCGDYRQGACRSYLFIQVHASIPLHCLSSRLSVKALLYFLQKSSWRLTLPSSRVVWNGKRRAREAADFLFTFLFLFREISAEANREHMAARNYLTDSIRLDIDRHVLVVISVFGKVRVDEFLTEAGSVQVSRRHPGISLVASLLCYTLTNIIQCCARAVGKSHAGQRGQKLHSLSSI
ncbi:hypothetical protein Q8A67_008338 [Cirrhinus molitorella]|uniref:Uncharacterized protein n=1 Tax=Cirrhinus molitorella TaxID=172907 RepID=A0AA88TSP5_9TELE|nr:hypothetical protein Q8A67_008338 [Cirrhinus molitorella]